MTTSYIRVNYITNLSSYSKLSLVNSESNPEHALVKCNIETEVMFIGKMVHVALILLK